MMVQIFVIVIYVFGKVTKGTGGLGNKRISGSHPNYCIINIGQITDLVG